MAKISEELAAAWARQDAEHAARDDKPSWQQPPPQRMGFWRGLRWTHRLRGHHTRSRYDYISWPYAWQCLECDLTVGRA